MSIQKSKHKGNNMETSGVDKMGTFELARWGALIEAVNFIADKCDEKKIEFNKVQLEPLALRKYIEQTCDAFCRKLESDDAYRDAKHDMLQKSIAAAKEKANVKS